MSDALNQTNGICLVSTPNNKPKKAGASSAFCPSDTVGVAIIANTMIQRIPPNVGGRRFTTPYQHHKMMSVPKT